MTEMKKIFFTLTALSLTFFSCNDWLDLDPALEIKGDQMYQTEQGFKDVLTGVYIQMARPSLYGKNTSMVLPEMLAQHWKITADTLTTSVSGFDFTQNASRKLLEAVWLQYYQCIVNLNALLAQVDEQKGVFRSGNYELVKGEALGLRAFLHLEVLRYWGDTPAGIVMGNKAIPYMTIQTKDPNKLVSVTYKEVLDHILADLNEAEKLLANDPILEFPYDKLNRTSTVPPLPSDDFYYYRQTKFNYLAVKATKARYYLWLGQTAKAAEYAKEVINAKVHGTETPVFRLGSDGDPLTFPTEQIFAVCNSQSTATLTPVFFQWHTGYSQDAAKLDVAFEKTAHPSDSRYQLNRLWEVKGSGSTPFNYFKKYNATETTAVTDIPLIRLSEMHFIATENGETDLFRPYRISRGLSFSLDGTLTSHQAIMERLEKEYRKDFYGEGQMFFFYKRLGYKDLTWPAAKQLTLDSYKLPIPETQTLFE